jgi:hypothetical protein
VQFVEVRILFREGVFCRIFYFGLTLTFPRLPRDTVISFSMYQCMVFAAQCVDSSCLCKCRHRDCAHHMGHPAKNNCSTEVLLDFCTRVTFLRSVCCTGPYL